MRKSVGPFSADETIAWENTREGLGTALGQNESSALETCGDSYHHSELKIRRSSS